VQQGLLSVAKRCSYCRGRGKLVTNPCDTCHGSGQVSAGSKLRVRIPAGADEGTVLRYPGEGEPGSGGGPAGDLRVVLSVQPHAIFTREGFDIHCEVPITFVEATLGGHVEVPTLDGRVRMKVPAGTQSGRVFRLRGRGLPLLSGQGRGDQHVTVVVETPQGLSDEDRELVEGLLSLDDAEHHPMRARFWRKVKAKKSTTR
jgi:molecular chaperone DnaJ